MVLSFVEFFLGSVQLDLNHANVTPQLIQTKRIGKEIKKHVQYATDNVDVDWKNNNNYIDLHIVSLSFSIPILFFLFHKSSTQLARIGKVLLPEDYYLKDQFGVNFSNKSITKTVYQQICNIGHYVTIYGVVVCDVQIYILNCE